MLATQQLIEALTSVGQQPPKNLFPGAVAQLTDPVRLYAIAGRHPGLVTRGNIDLAHRPVVRNPDGSVSTVRSMSFGLDGGREVLVPTVVGGRVVTPDEAIAAYRRTGKHLGIFDSPAAADRYAEQLHRQQARAYTGGR